MKRKFHPLEVFRRLARKTSKLNLVEQRDLLIHYADKLINRRLR